MDKTPERSPKRPVNQTIGRQEKTSPLRNRFAPLENSKDLDFWDMELEDPSKKRQREYSPTQEKISQKKANKKKVETSPEKDLDTTQEFTPERSTQVAPRRKTRSMSEGLDKIELAESNDMIGIRNEMEEYKKAMEKESKTANENFQRMEIAASVHATQGNSSPVNDDEKIRKRQAKEDEEAAEGFWNPSPNPNLVSLELITPSQPATQHSKALDSTQENSDAKQDRSKINPQDGKTLSIEGLKIHRPNCGCHSCFMQVMAKMENVTKAKVEKTVDLFRKQKSTPQTHFQPPNQCKCAMHLNIKCKEHTWLEKLYKETKEREEHRKREKTKSELRQWSSDTKRT